MIAANRVHRKRIEEVIGRHRQSLTR